MTKGTIILLSFSILLVLMGMSSLSRSNKRKKNFNKLEKDLNFNMSDPYSGYLSSSNLVTKLQVNNLINKLGKTNEKSYDRLSKIFDNAKNPWGITPTIFNFIRVAGGIGGVIFGLVLSGLFSDWTFMFFGVMISFLSIWYPIYYYKAIAKEREVEWNKIYEFMWVVKHTSMLYDAKKVCIETRNYVAEHYPEYKEIIIGLDDFNIYWQDNEIPKHILRYYNFAIPKELYTILFNMNLTGTDPDSSLRNLRSFALNKHNETIQRTLSNVPSQATLASLPFLMMTIMIVLLVPMLIQFLNIM